MTCSLPIDQGVRGTKPTEAGAFGVGACPPMIANKSWVTGYVLVKLRNVLITKIFLYGSGFKRCLLGYILGHVLVTIHWSASTCMFQSQTTCVCPQIV